MKRPIFIGPFLGEFGWELCTWNPLARKAAAQARKEGRHVIVAAPRASQYLYEFANEFHAVRALPGTSEGLTGQPIGGSPELERLARSCRERVTPNERLHGDPDRAGFRQPNLFKPLSSKEFRLLGRDREDLELPEAEICVAFRPPKMFRGVLYEEKSWPLERCQELVQSLQRWGARVAAVGGLENWAPGIEPGLDFRGEPLATQAALIARSRLVIGPSSGPLHLASLCGTQHLTWYGRGGSQNMSSRARYERVWNPFQTPVRFLDSLCPEVHEVSAAAQWMLR